MARETGLEPATSGVTGRRSNQLSYSPAGRCHGVRAARSGCGIRVRVGPSQAIGRPSHAASLGQDSLQARRAEAPARDLAAASRYGSNRARSAPRMR